MKFTQLFKDDKAVSPVIGVILMVAITVILAAVIGTFVLGLGDQVSESAPQASFTFDYSGTDLTITHDGGDSIKNADTTLSIKFSGTGSGDSSVDTSFTGTVSAGSQASASSVDSTETVRVVWNGPSADNSATLGKWTGPDA